jgi:hypothetical protein
VSSSSSRGSSKSARSTASAQKGKKSGKGAKKRSKSTESSPRRTGKRSAGGSSKRSSSAKKGSKKKGRKRRSASGSVGSGTLDFDSGDDSDTLTARTFDDDEDDENAGSDDAEDGAPGRGGRFGDLSTPPPTPPTPPPPPLTDAERKQLVFTHLVRSSRDSEVLNDWLLDALAHWRALTIRKAFREWRRQQQEWRHQSFFYQWREATRVRLAQKLYVFTLARRTLAHWILRARFSIGLPPLRARWFELRRVELLRECYDKWREMYFARFHQALIRFADTSYLRLGRRRGVRTWLAWAVQRQARRKQSEEAVFAVRRKRWYVRWHQSINLRVHRAANEALALKADLQRLAGKVMRLWKEQLKSKLADLQLLRLEKRYAMGQALILLTHWHARVTKTLDLRHNFEAVQSMRLTNLKRRLFQAMWHWFCASHFRRDRQMRVYRSRAIARWSRRAMHPDRRAWRVLRKQADAKVATRLHGRLHDLIEHWLYYKNISIRFRWQTQNAIAFSDGRGALLAQANYWRRWKHSMQRRLLGLTGLEIHKRNLRWARYNYLMHWYRVWMSQVRKQYNYKAAEHLHRRTQTRLAQAALTRWWCAFEDSVRAPTNLVSLTRAWRHWKALRDHTASSVAAMQRKTGLRKSFEAWYALMAAQKGLPNTIVLRRRQREIMFGHFDEFTAGAASSFGAFGGAFAGVGGGAGRATGFLSSGRSFSSFGRSDGFRAPSRSAAELWGDAAGEEDRANDAEFEAAMMGGEEVRADTTAAAAEMDSLAGPKDPSEAKFSFYELRKAKLDAEAAARAEQARVAREIEEAEQAAAAEAEAELARERLEQIKKNSTISSTSILKSTMANWTGRPGGASGAASTTAPSATAAEESKRPVLKPTVSDASSQSGSGGNNAKGGSPASSSSKSTKPPPLDPAADAGRYVSLRVDADWQFETDFARQMGRFERGETVARTLASISASTKPTSVREELEDPEWLEAERQLLHGGSSNYQGGAAGGGLDLSLAATRDRGGVLSSGGVDWSLALDDGEDIGGGADGGEKRDEFDVELARFERQLRLERRAGLKRAARAASASAAAAVAEATPALSRPSTDGQAPSAPTSPSPQGPAGAAAVAVTGASASIRELKERAAPRPSERIAFLTPTRLPPNVLRRDQQQVQGLTGDDELDVSLLSNSPPIGDLTLDQIIAGTSATARQGPQRTSRAAAGHPVRAKVRGRSVGARSRVGAGSKAATASSRRRRASSIPRSFGGGVGGGAQGNDVSSSLPSVFTRPLPGAPVQLYGSPRQMGKALARQYNSAVPRPAVLVPEATAAFGGPSSSSRVKQVASLLGFNYLAPPNLQIQHPSQSKAPLPLAALARSVREARRRDKEDERRLRMEREEEENREQREHEERVRDLLGPAAMDVDQPTAATHVTATESHKRADSGRLAASARPATASISRSRSRSQGRLISASVRAASSSSHGRPAWQDVVPPPAGNLTELPLQPVLLNPTAATVQSSAALKPEPVSQPRKVTDKRDHSNVRVIRPSSSSSSRSRSRSRPRSAGVLPKVTAARPSGPISTTMRAAAMSGLPSVASRPLPPKGSKSLDARTQRGLEAALESLMAKMSAPPQRASTTSKAAPAKPVAVTSASAAPAAMPSALAGLLPATAVPPPFPSLVPQFPVFQLTR